MFHLSGDLWFRREENGDVTILRKSDNPSLTFEIRTDPSGWASVVSSVCARGETLETWSAALDFHEKKD